MVSMSCGMETLSPPSSADAPCLVFLMSLGDLVLSGRTVGAKCSHRLTHRLFRVLTTLYIGCN